MQGASVWTKIRPMRRLVAIVMLMLLSLQSVWVAAAPYCQHEESTGLSHVGHHTHEHHGHDNASPTSAMDKAASADQQPGLDHADCHVFHAGCSPLSELAFNFHLRLSADRLGPEPLAALPSPLPHRPERPKWAGLA